VGIQCFGNTQNQSQAIDVFDEDVVEVEPKQFWFYAITREIEMVEKEHTQDPYIGTQPILN